MDSEKVKQVIIAYNSMKDACKAITEPIGIELKDTESVMNMSKEYKDTLEWFQTDCKVIQKVLSGMEGGIDDIKESIYDDGEIDNSKKLIADILFDNIPPKPRDTQADYMVNEALGILKRTGKALY